mmetsp:Transcript_3679/g.15271  ORF Transcript_3679/g.15271 Transcript_3679/m.15271 type:complete len:293 (-) Transcript_3679:33-911(-)
MAGRVAEHAQHLAGRSSELGLLLHRDVGAELGAAVEGGLRVVGAGRSARRRVVAQLRAGARLGRQLLRAEEVEHGPAVGALSNHEVALGGRAGRRCVRSSCVGVRGRLAPAAGLGAQRNGLLHSHKPRVLLKHARHRVRLVAPLAQVRLARGGSVRGPGPCSVRQLPRHLRQHGLEVAGGDRLAAGGQRGRRRPRATPRQQGRKAGIRKEDDWGAVRHVRARAGRPREAAVRHGALGHVVKEPGTVDSQAREGQVRLPGQRLASGLAAKRARPSLRGGRGAAAKRGREDERR